MSENDYIAEYVREKYPQILGLDFAFWKMNRYVKSAVEEMAKVFSKFSVEDIKQAIDENTSQGI